jgi:hypothetical protein
MEDAMDFLNSVVEGAAHPPYERRGSTPPPSIARRIATVVEPQRKAARCTPGRDDGSVAEVARTALRTTSISDGTADTVR